MLQGANIKRAYKSTKGRKTPPPGFSGLSKNPLAWLGFGGLGFRV